MTEADSQARNDLEGVDAAEEKDGSENSGAVEAEVGNFLFIMGIHESNILSFQKIESNSKDTSAPNSKRKNILLIKAPKQKRIKPTPVNFQ